MVSGRGIDGALGAFDAPAAEAPLAWASAMAGTAIALAQPNAIAIATAIALRTAPRSVRFAT